MNQKLILILVGVGLVSIGVGFVVGFFTNRAVTDDSNAKYYKKLIQDEDRSFFKKIEKNIDPEKIRAHLKHMTSIPHMAGTADDKLAIDYVYSTFKNNGLDKVDVNTYNVLLDFPDDEKFNNVQVRKSNQQIETVYEIEETTYDKELNYSGIPKPFLAYAAAGSLTYDEIYYANFCREDDFLTLLKNNFNVKNKLVICRYGKIFRGNKIEFAEKYGAKGVLLYDDPIRSAPSEYSYYVYPNGQFLPEKGVQRGTLLVREGDPSTPNYPSTEYAFREDNIATLPTIPAQVIGYGVAREIFKLIENGKQVDETWSGEMNVTYTYGGKLTDNRLVTLNVYNKRKYTDITNVYGIIEGSIEPDRYVMIGNHRDAWSFGSLDPTSGTSVLLEISRVLGEMKKSGKWQPKRSIIFISWDAEEYSLLGSQEWVEEYKKKLISNAVAYINMDVLLFGNYSYEAVSSPLLYDLIFDIIHKIDIAPGETVFQRWAKNEPNPDDPSQPYITPYLGAGSDHAGLTQKIGIPCVDHYFIRDKNDPMFKNLDTYTYPTYHSSYETFNLVEKYLDPKFQIFKIMGLITTELARRISDSLILPFNCSRYAEVIHKEFEQFIKAYGDDLKNLNIDTSNFQNAVKNLTLVTRDFHNRLDAINKKQYHLVRMYNEKLKDFERAFLDSSGILRAGYEHMIFAPSLSDSYGTDSFPSITDAIYDFKQGNRSSELLKEIKLQISIVTYAIQSASLLLKEPVDFTRYVY